VVDVLLYVEPAEVERHIGELVGCLCVHFEVLSNECAQQRLKIVKAKVCVSDVDWSRLENEVCSHFDESSGVNMRDAIDGRMFLNRRGFELTYILCYCFTSYSTRVV
jgi:hypothetical protein